MCRILHSSYIHMCIHGISIVGAADLGQFVLPASGAINVDSCLILPVRLCGVNLRNGMCVCVI